uniref:Mos1 transposase HTH domain-containing protein n=1 Tax=Cyprinodon variegatus TaxID=28743 RepID=A0A3Q2DUE6_CYPVA
MITRYTERKNMKIFIKINKYGSFDEIKETYGDDAPSYDLVKHWHREFKHGWKSVETAPRPGRPSSAIDEAAVRQVEAAILEDRCITVRQIAQEVKISIGSVETIIHVHLHMHKVSARWMLRLLTVFQKQERVECSRINLESGYMIQENSIVPLKTFFECLICTLWLKFKFSFCFTAFSLLPA